MVVRGSSLFVAAALLVAPGVVPACSKKTDVDASRTNDTTIDEVVRIVGPAGARVELAGRARVDIPPGALREESRIRLADVTRGSHPALPPGAALETGVYSFEPHGQAFEANVVVTLFHAEPPASGAGLSMAPLGGTWSRLPDADNGAALAQVSIAHFSYFAVTRDAVTDGGAGGAGGADGAAGAGGLTRDGASAEASAGAPPAAGAGGEGATTGADASAGAGGTAGSAGAGVAGAGGTGGSAGAAGASDSGTGGCGEVDIIVTVDTSGSMDEEATAIGSGFPGLFDAVRSLDVRLVVFSAVPPATGGLCVPPPFGTGSCPDDEKLPAFRHVVGPVSEQYALQRLVNDHALYASTVRDTARTHIIVVSDEPSIMTPQQFTDQFVPLAPGRRGFVFHGVFATTDCTGVSGSATAAPTYVALAAATGGRVADLCNGELYTYGRDIGDAIVAASALPCH